MDIQQNFTTLIDEDKDVIPFLKKLPLENRKLLIPTIKKLQKKYGKFVEKKDPKGGTHYGSVGTSDQLEKLNIAGFISMNLKEYKASFYSIDQRILDGNFLDWYCPKWLSEYLNTEQVYYLDYKTLLSFSIKGYLQPTPELIVQKLPQAIFQSVTKTNEHEYAIENLFLNAITLKEHIWYLFQYNSEINWSDRYIRLQGTGTENPSWSFTFKSLILDGNLDREMVLKEALLTSTRNFNKTLTGWFFDLFKYLTPTKEELLKLQDTIFLVFNGQHSKPINTCLSYIKTICLDKKFNIKEFIDIAPILLTSEVKAVVNSSLMILDKLAKKHAKYSEAICLVSCEALLHQDEKIQSRAAKLIQKHGDTKSVAIKETIGSYYEGLFSSIKSLFVEFDINTDEFHSIENIIAFEPIERITENNLLTSYNTIDDIIFFMSQAFDNNEVYHFDLFLALLPKLDKLLDADNVTKLEPAFQRAFKFITPYYESSRQGWVEKLMAISFINYGEIVFKRFPKETENIQRLYDKTVKKDIERGANNSDTHSKKIMSLRDFELEESTYDIFISRLLYCKSIIVAHKEVEMLATPTHYPCWIDGEILLSRLAAYRIKKELPNPYDFQVALERAVFETSNDLIKLVKATLEGEFKELFLYLLGVTKLNLSNIKHPAYWLPAILRVKNKSDLEQFLQKYDTNQTLYFLSNPPNWIVKIAPYTYKEYDYKTKQHIEISSAHKNIKFTDQEKKGTLFSKLKKVVKLPNSDFQSIYTKFTTKGRQFPTIHPHDDKKFLLLIPSHPELALKMLAKVNFSTFSYPEVSADKNTTNALSVLVDIWNDESELSYLYLGCSLLFISKTPRLLASELWIKYVSAKKIDNSKLGKVLGKLQFQEIAPLKRLTDLILNSMFNISKIHNQGLEILIANMIKNMNDEPIKGTKKLLEIYTELLVLNQSKTDSKIKLKLKAWMATKSLSKIIGLLLK